MDFEVHRGEDVAVIAPSGSGKSTLLRCLNLLQLPSSGRLLVDGEPVVDIEKDRFPGKQRLTNLRRQVGMVFQSFNLFPHPTAVEDVTLGLTYALKPSKEEGRASSLVGTQKFVFVSCLALSFRNREEPT
jgi:ABC-type polar amino acid transport system ATPase subunit